MTTRAALRVGVWGYGAIGKEVARALAADELPGATLAGIISRRPELPNAPENGGYTRLTLDTAKEHCDLIVECATGDRLREHGPALIAAGVDLLPASLGALAKPATREALIERGPGRCFLTSGAIGGLDLLSAAARSGGLDAVSLTSTKRASSLATPWMTEEERERLDAASEPFTLFEGTVQRAIELFPASLNVGVALAAATGMWNEVIVRLVADPHADRTVHRIVATGAAGEYDFSITNHPMPDSPRSSGVVAHALLRGIAAIARPSGSFV